MNKLTVLLSGLIFLPAMAAMAHQSGPPTICNYLTTKSHMSSHAGDIALKFCAVDATGNLFNCQSMDLKRQKYGTCVTAFGYQNLMVTAGKVYISKVRHTNKLPDNCTANHVTPGMTLTFDGEVGPHKASKELHCSLTHLNGSA